LFGQYAHTRVPWIVPRMTVLAALGFIGFVLAGLVHVVRNRAPDAPPFVLYLLIGLAGQVAYVASAPFSSSQDFRYSLPLLLPLCWLFARGADLGPRVRLAWRGAGATLAATQVLFAAWLILG
jgi:hypothetical protein